MQNSARRYGIFAIVLHWSTAFCIFALIGLGFYMTELDYYHPLYYSSLDWHRSLGVIALLLATVKIVHKIAAPSPPLSGLSASEYWAAKIMHILLFAMMLAVPVSGYLVSTSAGAGVSVFNLFVIPPIFASGDELRDGAIAVHYWLAYGGGVLALGHAAAALKHHFVDKNDILRQMLP